jgi:hypothetical protein
MLAATIDWDALLDVLWTAVLGGIGVTAAYGVAILGVTRAVDFSRNGRSLEATAYGVLGVIAMIAVVGSVVFGIVVLTSK